MEDFPANHGWLPEAKGKFPNRGISSITLTSVRKETLRVNMFMVVPLLVIPSYRSHWLQNPQFPKSPKNWDGMAMWRSFTRWKESVLIFQVEESPILAYLVGIPTPLKNIFVRQLGWNSQLNPKSWNSMVPNHQSASISCWWLMALSGPTQLPRLGPSHLPSLRFWLTPLSQELSKFPAASFRNTLLRRIDRCFL